MPVTTGKQVWIVADGWDGGDLGDFTLRVAKTRAPAGDVIATATNLATRLPLVVTGSTSAYLNDYNYESTYGGGGYGGNGADRVFRFTPTFTGQVCGGGKGMSARAPAGDRTGALLLLRRPLQSLRPTLPALRPAPSPQLPGPVWRLQHRHRRRQKDVRGRPPGGQARVRALRQRAR